MEIDLQYLYSSSDAMMVPAELAGFALADTRLLFAAEEERGASHEGGRRAAADERRLGERHRSWQSLLACATS